MIIKKVEKIKENMRVKIIDNKVQRKEHKYINIYRRRGVSFPYLFIYCDCCSLSRSQIQEHMCL